MLIVIEGIDGSGKGTQAAELMKRLTSPEEGVDAHLFSFPCYKVTKFGAAVGDYLNGKFGNAVDVHPKLAAMLYACDRYESKAELEAQLDARDVVVCDRYVPSNLAHQAAKVDGSEAQDLCRWLDEVEYDIFQLPVPDLVIQLDLPVELATQLIAKKQARDYTDSKADGHEADLGYLERVRDCYNHLHGLTRYEDWQRIVVNHGAELRTVEQVAADIWETVQLHRCW